MALGLLCSPPNLSGESDTSTRVVCCPGFSVACFGFGVHSAVGVELGVLRLGFRAWCLAFEIWRSGFRNEGMGCRSRGVGFQYPCILPSCLFTLCLEG